MRRLVIDGNSVYEIDEECEMRGKEQTVSADEDFSDGPGRWKKPGKSNAAEKNRKRTGTIGNKR